MDGWKTRASFLGCGDRWTSHALRSLFFACFGTSTFLLLYIYAEQLCVVPIWEKTEMQRNITTLHELNDRQAVDKFDPSSPSL